MKVRYKPAGRKTGKPLTLARFTIYAVVIYGAFILFFAGIYFFFMFDYLGANRWQSTLLIRGGPVRELSVWEAVYFSATTTFTIGYGDITPVGWCRWIAVVEGFCGYLAPTLCVAVGLSMLLNHQYDHLRRIRNEQRVLLELVAKGWDITAISDDPAASRVALTLCDQHGCLQNMDLGHCCLDFSAWRGGYLSAWEENALQKVELWLRKLKKTK